MTTMADVPGSEGSQARSSPSEIRRRFLRGLLYREWLVTREWQELFLMIWLLGVWGLVIFYDPVFMLVFGVIYAVVAGPALGGMDVADGSEEFTLALPPTRRERFLTRLALGGGVLLAYELLGLAAIRWNLPQRAWGLVVESGLTEPFRPVGIPGPYLRAFCAPLAVFGVGFSISAVSHSSDTVTLKGWVAAAIGATLWGVGVLLERMFGYHSGGFFPSILLLSFAGVCVVVAYPLYQRKEAVARPSTVESDDAAGKMPQVLLALLLGLFIALAVANVAVRRQVRVQPAVPTQTSAPSSVTGGIHLR